MNPVRNTEFVKITNIMSNLISNRVKKYIFGALLVLALIVVPVASQAVTIAELQAQVAALLAEIARLQSTSSITINSVSGPTSLSVNQTGTWSLNVTAPSNTNLTYSVDWGDLAMAGGAGGNSNSSVNQGSTFTHAYSSPGTYTVRFTVRSGSVAATCPVGGICVDPTLQEAKTSLTVVVGSNNNQGTPIANFTGGPISLQNGRIGAAFSGTITASGGDIFVHKVYPFGAQFVNETTGVGVFANSCQVTSMDYGANLPITVDRYGQPLTIIKNGTSAQYKVEISCIPEQMLPGIYYAKLTHLNYYVVASDAQTTQFSIGVRSSNSRYIVGETFPWLVSARYTGDKDGVVITGERLMKVSRVYFNGQVVSKENTNWISNKEMSIVPSTRTSGRYPVYVEFTGGKSNIVYVTIGGEANPSITVISPNGGERYVLGNPITISWKGGATQCPGYCTGNNIGIITLEPGDSASPTPVSTVGIIGGVKEGQKNFAWDGKTIYRSFISDENRMNVSPGSYKIYMGILSDFDISDASFTITSGATTSPVCAQDMYVCPGTNISVPRTGPSCQFVCPVSPVTNTLSNLTSSGSSNTWTQGTTKTFNWQTTGSIPYVDVILCEVGASCYYFHKNITNTGSANVAVISTTIGSSVKVIVREAGKATPSVTSPIFTVLARSSTSSNVSQAKINELANALSAIKAILSQLGVN